MSTTIRLSNGHDTSFSASNHNSHNHSSAKSSSTPQIGRTAQMERFSKGCDKIIELGRKAKAENVRTSYVQTEKLRQEQLQDATREAHRTMNAAHIRLADNKTKSDQYGAQMLLSLQEYVKSGIEAEYKAGVLAKCEANEELYLAQWKDYKMKQIHQQLTADLRPVVEAELARDSAARVDKWVRSELRDELRQEVIESLKAEHTVEVQDFLYNHLKDPVIAELRRNNEAMVIKSLRSELCEKIKTEMREQMRATPDRTEEMQDVARQERISQGTLTPDNGLKQQSSRDLSNERGNRVRDEPSQARSPEPAGTTNEESEKTNAGSNVDRNKSSPLLGSVTAQETTEAHPATNGIASLVSIPEDPNIHYALDGPIFGAQTLEDQYFQSKNASIEDVNRAFASGNEFAEPLYPEIIPVSVEDDQFETAKENYASGYESGDEGTDHEEIIEASDGTAINLHIGEHAEPVGSLPRQPSPLDASPTSTPPGRKRSLSEVDGVDEQLNQSAKRFRDGSLVGRLSSQGEDLIESNQYDMAVKLELDDSQQGLVQDAQIDRVAVDFYEDSSEDEDGSGSEESYDEEGYDRENYPEGTIQGERDFEGEEFSYGENDDEDEEDSHIGGEFEDSYGSSEGDNGDGGNDSASQAAAAVINKVNTQDTAWNIDDSGDEEDEEEDEEDQTLVEDADFAPVNKGNLMSYDDTNDKEGMVSA